LGRPSFGKQVILTGTRDSSHNANHHFIVDRFLEKNIYYDLENSIGPLAFDKVVGWRKGEKLQQMIYLSAGTLLQRKKTWKTAKWIPPVIKA
jgi:hypothetical protein